MNGRRRGYGCDGIYWQDGVAVAAAGAWQPQKAVGGPSGGLWLNDKRVHETRCETQSSSDLMYPSHSFWAPCSQMNHFGVVHIQGKPQLSAQQVGEKWQETVITYWKSMSGKSRE